MNNKKDKMSIDTITIDFWNTMFSSHHVSDKHKKDRWDYKFYIYNSLARRYNLTNYTNSQIERAIKKEHKVAFDIWKNEQRTMKLSDRIRITLDELKLNISEEDIRKLVTIYNNFIFFRPPVEAKNLGVTLERLSNKGIKLAVVSDTGYIVGSNIKKFLESRGLLKYFSAFSFSDETGFSKPNKNTFTKIIDELNISDSSSVLHVGDMEEVDIIGAKKAGLKSCIYTGLSFVKYDSFNTNADIHIKNWKDLTDYIKIF